MDKLTVINMALMKCGLPLAANLEDCDWNAHIIFDNVANQVFRSASWGFATVYKVLPRSTKTPEHSYAYAYELPKDCMFFIDVRENTQLRAPKAQEVHTGGYIYTNASPCNARYVSNLVPIEDWPPDFTDAVACLLAAQIAALSAEKSSMVAQLMSLYQYSVSQAQLNDARENTERVPLPNSIYEARGASSQG